MHSVLIVVALLCGLGVTKVITCYTKEFICHEVKDLSLVYFDDCEDALTKGFSNSGVYRIKPKTSFRPFKVWCDMESEGGGWTVIQTRFDGLVDFYRNWTEYRNGFGNVDGEYWLGNNFIRHLTQHNDYELKIQLTGFEATEFASARYSPFQIGTEDEKYKLFAGKFTSEGAITDSFSGRNGFMFTTKDSDNDIWSKNCADLGKGAWWYNNCFSSNLNGIWMNEEKSKATKGPQSVDNVYGIIWRHVFGVDFYSLKSVEMKVRKMRSN